MKESDYCKICKLYSSCTKSKTCTCEDFVTDVDMKSKRRKKYQ